MKCNTCDACEGERQAAKLQQPPQKKGRVTIATALADETRRALEPGHT